MRSRIGIRRQHLIASRAGPGAHRAGHDVRSFESLRLPGPDETANYELPITVDRSPQLPKRRKRDRDREERIRLAGGPKPSLQEKAYAFARERATVRTCDFTAIGIPRHYLAWMCQEGSAGEGQLWRLPRRGSRDILIGRIYRSNRAAASAKSARCNELMIRGSLR